MIQEEIRKIFDADVAAITEELGIEIPKAVFRYAPALGRDSAEYPY